MLSVCTPPEKQPARAFQDSGWKAPGRFILPEVRQQLYFTMGLAKALRAQNYVSIKYPFIWFMGF